MSVRAAAALVFLASLSRILGGLVLLWLLGAPAWALAAWLLLHFKVTLDLSRLKGKL